MTLLRIFCLIALLFPIAALSQTTGDSTSAPGSALFKISGSRSFWMGSNYRKEWKTPVRVQVLNMEGITPVKLGGGKQTKSLRVKDANGKEYSLRSIQKFITSESLPGDIESEAAEDLVQDGVSASYPYAALSIPPLADAAGVPYLKAKLVFIPDHPNLGEHREEFKNMLAYMEDRELESVKKQYDTEEVVEKLKDDNDNSIDQQALLRARILDMYVMDFDRHEGQWEWGAVDKAKGKEYYPIPKDRDQAFYINEGVIPHIVSWPWLVPQVEGLKTRTRNMKRFNYAARNFDRFFLNKLTEKDWTEAVAKFLSQMTDAVIEKALAQQPREIYGISTGDIIYKLKERRKHLASEVLEYYKFLAEEVDITTSDKKELVDITRNDDGSVLVQIFKMSDGNPSDKIYERNFDGQDTKELRIYSFGGDDKFVVKGSNDKIKIRMIGGDGEDNFENTNSQSKGGIVYDSLDGNNTITGKFKNKMSNDTIANHYDPIYYKYNQVIPFLSVGFNPDDGVYLGGWMKITHRGFRKEPYKNSHTITLNHALATRAWNFRYNGEFIGVFGRKSDLVFEADLRAPKFVSNFFGYGENSVYDKSKPGKFRYYRARYNLGDFSILLRKNFSEKVIMTIGPTFQTFKTDSTDSKNRTRFITQTPENGLDPNTVFARQNYFGGKFSLIADTRDKPGMPRRGIYWQATVRHLSGLTDASYEVTQLNSDFTFHISLVKNVVVIANRFGGGHNFGDFEFHQAQYLGSEDNLRGYRRYRFAGRSKAFNNFDLRIAISKFRTYLFTGSWGILGFVDAGKIWADNDTSDDVLVGYGGGIWIAPLRRFVLNITYMMSEEDKFPTVGLGWRF